MTAFIIAQLTIQETQRRRILWLGLLMAAGFLAIFGVGLHFIYDDMVRGGMGAEEIGLAAGGLLAAGLYVVNFLIIMMSVLTSVTAVSGEIESHTIETLVTKPVRRWEIVLGKWLGFVALLIVYVLLLAGGLIVIFTLRTGIVANNIVAGLALMVLQGTAVLSLTMLGGTRLSTLANGVLAFALYGVAFIGGWVEQIGALFRNETAVDIGIATSLLMPTEILWKQALALFQPQLSNSPFEVMGPFAVASQPSAVMLWYAVGYTAVLLLLALASFTRRDL